MQAKFRLKVGQDEFELNFDVKDEKDFFEQVSFYTGLPKTAPGGSTDLRIAFRTTPKDGHKYYSLISDKEKLEFKLGQNKDAQGGGLFPKGWSPLFEAEGAQTAAAPVGAPVQVPRAAAPVATPVAVPQPVAMPAVATPVPAPVVMPQPVAAPIPAPVAMPVAAPVAAPPAAAPAANPAVTAVANNVLARFGVPAQK